MYPPFRVWSILMWNLTDLNFILLDRLPYQD